MISHLSCRVPEEDALTELDSFDLAFMVMMGYVKMAPLSEALERLTKADKRTQMWGPEVEMASQALIRAFRKENSAAMKDFVAAFDTSGDISVDGKKARKAIVRVTASKMKNVWKASKEKVLQALAVASERAEEHYIKQSKKTTKKVQKQEAAFQLWMTEALGDHVEAFTTQFPKRVLHPEARRLVKLAELSPGQRLIDKANLKNRIETFTKMPGKYIDGVADVQIGRAWTFTGLEMAKQNRVTACQIVAHRDEVTCPVCESFDGKYVDVAPAHANMMQLLEAPVDADGLVAAAPFPRLPDIDNKSPSQVRALGFLPPFHNKCRCDIVYLWGEVAVPLPKGPAPLPQAKDYKATAFSPVFRGANKEKWRALSTSMWNDMPPNMRTHFEGLEKAGTKFKVVAVAREERFRKAASGMVDSKYLPGMKQLSMDVMGSHAAGSNAVFIRESGVKTMRQVGLHEIGHETYAANNGYWKTEWNALSSKTPKSKRISVYAGVDNNEHFAETFSVYITDGARLQKKNPTIYGFMKEKIFEGHEYL